MSRSVPGSRRTRLAALAAALLLPSLAAAADETEDAPRPPPPGPRALLLLGYDAGLHRSPSVVVEGGQTQDLGAGGGLVLAAGVAWPLEATGRWALRGTLGWKSDRTGSTGTGLGFSAVPLEVLAAHHRGAWTLSGGLSCLLGPRYQGSGSASRFSLPLRTALGLVGQVEVGADAPGSRVRTSVGLRVAWQSLVARDGSSGTDASTIGLFTALAF